MYKVNLFMRNAVVNDLRNEVLLPIMVIILFCRIGALGTKGDDLQYSGD